MSVSIPCACCQVIRRAGEDRLVEAVSPVISKMAPPTCQDNDPDLEGTAEAYLQDRMSTLNDIQCLNRGA